MPNALSNLQKKVNKKKGNLKSLHENSRDAQRLRRAGARSDKLERIKTARQQANQSYVQRVEFFRDAAVTAKTSFDAEGVHKLIQSYLSRDDEELAELKSQRRPGRPPSTREDALKRRMDADDQEYSIGFWLPNMQDEENLGQLVLWSGEWASLSTLKFVRLARDGVTKQSIFPPKGQS